MIHKLPALIVLRIVQIAEHGPSNTKVASLILATAKHFPFPGWHTLYLRTRAYLNVCSQAKRLRLAAIWDDWYNITWKESKRFTKENLGWHPISLHTLTPAGYQLHLQRLIKDNLETIKITIKITNEKVSHYTHQYLSANKFNLVLIYLNVCWIKHALRQMSYFDNSGSWTTENLSVNRSVKPFIKHWNERKITTLNLKDNFHSTFR